MIKQQTQELGKFKFDIPSFKHDLSICVSTENTMTTMTEDPYVHHIPTLTGGRDYDGVCNFYKNHFIGKMPKDFKVTKISRTIGKDQVVDELIISFTHDTEIEYMLPGVAPTGRYVEIPM